MTTLPYYAVQGALDILLQHTPTPDVGGDLANMVGGSSISLGNHEIEQLEKECRTLQAVIDTFTNSVLQRITAIHKERNQLVPIHRLPLEILIAIFELTQSSSPYHFYTSLHPLLQVSSHWRTVIQSSPCFWSTISTACNPQLIKTVLERSKNAPLDIHCNSLESGKRGCFKTALPLASRWRSVIIPGDLLAEFSEWCLTTKELPLLEKFAVTGPYKPFREVPAVVLDGAPRLFRLHIPSCNLPLGSGVFSKLTRIHIAAVVNNKALSCAQWHAILSSAPQLQRICAEGAKSVLQPPEKPSIFRVNMPELEVFQLWSIHSLMIGTLLCSVTVPQNSYPKVTLSLSTNDGYGFMDIFPTLAPTGSLLSRIREMSWVKGHGAEWDEPTVTAGRDEGGKLFSLYLDGDLRPKGDLFRSLVPSDGLPSLRHITLGTDQFFEDEYFSSSISSCKGLERLVLVYIGWRPSEAHEGSLDSLAQLCTDLTTLKRDTELDKPYWPCPNLKYLVIGSYSSADLTPILRLLKARNRLTSMDGGSPSSVLPVALEQLRLRIMGGDGRSFRTRHPDLTAELEAVAKSHNTKLFLFPITSKGEEVGQGIVGEGSEHPEDEGFDDIDESEHGGDSRWPW